MGRQRKPENAHLPRYVQFKRGRYYVTMRDDNNRRVMRAAGATVTSLNLLLRKLGYPLVEEDMPDGFPKALWLSARSRARTKGLPFEISIEDVAALIEAAGGRCPIAGTPFTYGRAHGERFRPWAPSIDRIDRALGYVPNNCRIVCAYVNLAMNEFGEHVFASVVQAAARQGALGVSARP